MTPVPEENKDAFLAEPPRPSSTRSLAEEDILTLIERCKSGERSAWKELIRRFENLIFAYAQSLCHNPTDASDITSEVFLRLFVGLPTFRPGKSSFRTWLLHIVHNTYIDVCVRDSHRRHLSLNEKQQPASNRYELVDPAASPEAVCVHQEQLRSLTEAIRTLPAYQRQVLDLFVAGRSYKEIAALTGHSMGTVKSRINRARTTLRQRLEESGQEPPARSPG
ncbi:MAG TPA: sigma-70 family RNA polymerase sigma factor [Chthonomonadaceae bacterium]|nr:sigma-70 family RNA polymerase sigma factor [Chthonomonadaceae bacterium]